MTNRSLGKVKLSIELICKCGFFQSGDSNNLVYYYYPSTGDDLYAIWTCMYCKTDCEALVPSNGSD